LQTTLLDHTFLRSDEKSCRVDDMGAREMGEMGEIGEMNCEKKEEVNQLVSLLFFYVVSCPRDSLGPASEPRGAPGRVYSVRTLAKNNVFCFFVHAKRPWHVPLVHC